MSDFQKRHYLHGATCIFDKYPESEWAIDHELVKGRRPYKSLHFVQLLKEALKTHGTKWSLVACMVPSRTATQCRERWVNVLDTSLNRGRWEPEEDQRLISICRKYEGEG